MKRNEQGDRIFESTAEAQVFIEDESRKIARWLYECREHGGILLSYPHYRSKLNDISNITRRFLLEQERLILRLREEKRELSESSLCPRCLQHRSELKG